ncbi:MAG: adenylate/guanylate cyclase domain-containing protein [Acidimicrobiales bacterium]
MSTCPECGEVNPDRFRFCGICGATFTNKVPEETVRRTVSVVYSDLKGSTSLAERLDTESLWEVLGVYFDAMQTVLDRHGGTVQKYIGDAIMAVFGHSVAHEDDALRAVRAACEMRDALPEINERLLLRWGVTLENRTGVNTGEVVSGSPTVGQHLTTGDIVNVAARLEQAAPSCEVLISESTYHLVQHAIAVEELEPLELKGKSEPVRAYRLLSVSGIDAIKRRTDTPMVGRVAQLEYLRENYHLAMEKKECRVVTLIANAGLGKSRIVTEFSSELLDTATVLLGRCLSYGKGITFWPLTEVLRQAACIVDEDSEETVRSKLLSLSGPGNLEVSERLGSLMGLSSNIYGVDEFMWATRVVLDEMSRRKPLVIVFEDIHWAEPTFLDLVEHVVDTSHDAGILVVCAARHELMENRPSWMEKRTNAFRIEFSELSIPESALVLRHLLGGAELPEAFEYRILDAAAGNPLFIEQMISMLLDDGYLVETSEGRLDCTSVPVKIVVPPSILSLLVSRLDRLTGTERSVLQRASVIGHVFYPSAVAAMEQDDSLRDVSEVLSRLSRRRLIRPAESSFAGEPAFQFAHVLSRDAAYEGVLKRNRSRFHEGFASWLLALPGDRVAEHEEIVGYHLEQAVAYRAELAVLDSEGRTLARNAAGHLRSAGERALMRQDESAAANLLLRSANLLEDNDKTKVKLLIQVGVALMETAQLVEAASVLDHAIELGIALSDEALETTARLARLFLDHSTNPQVVATDVADEARRAIDIYTARAEHDVLYFAWRLLVSVNWAADTFGPAEEAIEQAFKHAEAGGNHAAARGITGGLPSCAVYGPSPVPRAIARCEELLAQVPNETRTSALARSALARLEAMQGNFDRARTLYRSSRGALEEFGYNILATLTSIDSGPVEMLAGNPQAAERELRGDYEALVRMGERNYISTTAALLAEAVYRQGRLDEAADLVDVSREIASPEDVVTQVMWRSVQSKLCARTGNFDKAEVLAHEAIDLVDRTDHLDAQGSARLDAAEVYLLMDRRGDRARVLAEAIERFERKGNVVSLAAARAEAQDKASVGPSNAGS